MNEVLTTCGDFREQGALLDYVSLVDASKKRGLSGREMKLVCEGGVVYFEALGRRLRDTRVTQADAKGRQHEHDYEQEGPARWELHFRCRFLVLSGFR